MIKYYGACFHCKDGVEILLEAKKTIGFIVESDGRTVTYNISYECPHCSYWNIFTVDSIKYK